MKKVYYPGVGERMVARLKTLGYEKPEAEYGVDVERFCWDYRFGRTNVYNWLSDEATPVKDLTRLCDVLGVSEVWLLQGRERDPKAQPGKARQRGKARSLLLALSLGAAGVMWPSSVPAKPRTIAVGNLRTSSTFSEAGRRFRIDFRSFFGGMAFAL
jgi:hypothetical protein